MSKLQLIYPVQPIHVNQIFGANPPIYSDPKYGGIKGHNGIDFQASHGQPVYATHDGVCYPEVDAGGGNGVVIRTNQAFDYLGGQAFFKTIYWHLVQDDAVVKTGASIKVGDLIGYADNTGASTGDHLHFGLKPQAWNESNWIWYNIEQANGYNGAIDPQPYLHDPILDQKISDLTNSIQSTQLTLIGVLKKYVTYLQSLLHK